MSFRSWWSETVRFKEAIVSWVYWHRPEILAFRRVRLLDGAFGTSLWYIGKSWLKKNHVINMAIVQSFWTIILMLMSRP